MRYSSRPMRQVVRKQYDLSVDNIQHIRDCLRFQIFDSGKFVLQKWSTKRSYLSSDQELEGIEAFVDFAVCCLKRERGCMFGLETVMDRGDSQSAAKESPI